MKPVFILDPRAHLANLCTHAELVYLEPHVDKLNWLNLSMNPNAMPLIEQHLEERKDDLNWSVLCSNPAIGSLLKPELFRLCEKEIDWKYLSRNPRAIPFLKNHLNKVDWYYLCENEEALSILEQHQEKIEWLALSSNPNAMNLLRQNQDKVRWGRLCCNTNPEAIPLLESRIHSRIEGRFLYEKIYWHGLSDNPNALRLLEKYPDKIVWSHASMNPDILPLLEKNVDKVKWPYVCNDTITVDVVAFLEKHVDKLCGQCWHLLSERPVAVPLLEKYPEYIDWNRLSRNPAAIHLLERHPEKIDWNQLSVNPAALHLLFQLDHETMSQANEPFKEELLAYVFDPERLMRLSAQYKVDFRVYLRMY